LHNNKTNNLISILLFHHSYQIFMVENYKSCLSFYHFLSNNFLSVQPNRVEVMPYSYSRKICGWTHGYMNKF